MQDIDVLCSQLSLLKALRKSYGTATATNKRLLALRAAFDYRITQIEEKILGWHKYEEDRAKQLTEPDEDTNIEL